MTANIAGLTANVNALATFRWVTPQLRDKYLLAVEDLDPAKITPLTAKAIDAGANYRTLPTVFTGIHAVIDAVNA